ncbi:MAG: NAD(+) synthase [Eubacteriales bacterium]|jgi:NAD+ synthase|nr:NAD(+) synthase [Eubacteriales bacterium]
MEYFDSAFDPARVKDEIVAWIRDFFETSGQGCRAVVAISGGKDSSVVAALCTEALGKDRVLGVLLPNGEQSDIDMSKLLVSHLGIEYVTINIKSSYDAIVQEIEDKMGTISDQTRINLPARLRMATVYAVSQSRNGRVANTCNLSEDWVGYATRYGDGAGDFSPLGRLTVQEVRAVGRVLGLPDVLVDKVPVDGLQPKTDEERLGFTYDTLDRYIRTGEIDREEDREAIDRMRAASKFKLELMPTFAHDGPVFARS